MEYDKTDEEIVKEALERKDIKIPQTREEWLDYLQIQRKLEKERKNG